MFGLARLPLLSATLLVFPGVAAAQTSSFSFEVLSTSGWQTKSVLVEQGQELSFSATGSWNVDHRNFSDVGPDGYSPDEDRTIFQGCKLDPELPYGTLLVKVGDDPDFWEIGSQRTITADRDGALAFRIHDGDACLLDNEGLVVVTVTATAFPVVARSPFFYCISGPGEGGGCENLYTNPVRENPFTSTPPPEWLTTPLAAECFIPFTAEVLDALHPGAGKLAKLLDFAGFYETFYSLALQRQIPLVGAQDDPRYWTTLVDALGQHIVVDDITLRDCREWAATISDAR